ncbi:hypothetical protein [Atopobacter phocae]|uniref:hypothetical protein n=1 Tax=Atopobacter phocae TaxID=136492 RepID=UPI0004704C37|nr:hypothetical protein [Atopobacter phocae]
MLKRNQPPQNKYLKSQLALFAILALLSIGLIIFFNPPNLSALEEFYKEDQPYQVEMDLTNIRIARSGSDNLLSAYQDAFPSQVAIKGKIKATNAGDYQANFTYPANNKKVSLNIERQGRDISINTDALLKMMQSNMNQDDFRTAKKEIGGKTLKLRAFKEQAEKIETIHGTTRSNSTELDGKVTKKEIESWAKKAGKQNLSASKDEFNMTLSGDMLAQLITMLTRDSMVSEHIKAFDGQLHVKKNEAYVNGDLTIELYGLEIKTHLDGSFVPKGKKLEVSLPNQEADPKAVLSSLFGVTESKGKYTDEEFKELEKYIRSERDKLSEEERETLWNELDKELMTDKQLAIIKKLLNEEIKTDETDRTDGTDDNLEEQVNRLREFERNIEQNIERPIIRRLPSPRNTTPRLNENKNKEEKNKTKSEKNKEDKTKAKEDKSKENKPKEDKGKADKPKGNDDKAKGIDGKEKPADSESNQSGNTSEKEKQDINNNNNAESTPNQGEINQAPNQGESKKEEIPTNQSSQSNNKEEKESK